MKLATLKKSRARDGALAVVSHDQRRAVYATDVAPNLIHALENWSAVEDALLALSTRLDAGTAADAFDFDPAQAMAPLPRAPQWCDGSAFIHHAFLMQRAFGLPPIPRVDEVPLMYQGASDDFLGAHDDVPLPDEAGGIDFEGEFGVIVDTVPMGCTPAEAAGRIRLIVQINDVSLRAYGPHEMQTGFGFLHAKPSSSFAPLAVTPDELGSAWRDGRVHMKLHVEYNGAWFGQPHGGQMHFGFDELIAHAARTRRLSAGTIIGSGTVSNREPAAGSACIAERRAIEMLEHGEPRTGFMRFGDRVRMRAVSDDGHTPFGTIDQRVVRYPGAKP